MDRNEIYKKYKDAIDAVATAQDVDVFVAEDMVRSICQVRLGVIEGEINYQGLPEDFPCAEYLHDFYGEEALSVDETERVLSDEEFKGEE